MFLLYVRQSARTWGHIGVLVIQAAVSKIPQNGWFKQQTRIFTVPEAGRQKDWVLGEGLLPGF